MYSHLIYAHLAINVLFFIFVKIKCGGTCYPFFFLLFYWKNNFDIYNIRRDVKYRDLTSSSSSSPQTTSNELLFLQFQSCCPCLLVYICIFLQGNIFAEKETRRVTGRRQKLQSNYCTGVNCD